MIIAKAYEDYLISVSEGMSHHEATERACFMYDVTFNQLETYINLWK